jgi:hypothetical protein
MTSGKLGLGGKKWEGTLGTGGPKWLEKQTEPPREGIDYQQYQGVKISSSPNGTMAFP